MTIITSDSPVLDSAGQPANGLVVWEQSEEYISAEGRVTTARGELRMKNGRLVTARGAQVEIPETPDGQFVTITENYGGSPIYWTTNIPAGPQAEYNELERIVPPTSGPGVPSWVSPVLAVPAYVDAKVALVDAAADAAATSRDEAAVFGGTNNSQVAGFVTATGPTKSAIEGVMGEAVGPLVAGAIADDATLVEAAILAVDGAVEGLDLAETTSDPEDEWRQAILFEDREVWIGQRTDGTWYPEQLNPGSGGGGGDDELPVGGTAGQFLGKASSADGDVAWLTPPSSGGVAAVRHWLLVHFAGQSNQQGRSGLFSTYYDPAVPYIYQYGFKSRVLAVATEPLDMNTGVGGDIGMGPSLQFMRQAYAQGLNDGSYIVGIPSAKGGTPLVANGTPAASDTWKADYAGGLTDQWIAHRAAAIAAIEARGETWEDWAVIYTQGEQDGSNGITGTQYSAGLNPLLDKMVATVGPRVPIILGGVVPEGITVLNSRGDIEYEKALAQLYRNNVAYVPGVVGYAQNDNLHFRREGYELNAAAMLEPFKKLRSGLRVKSPLYSMARAFIKEFERNSSDVAVGDGAIVLNPESVWGLRGTPATAYLKTSAANAHNPIVWDTGFADGLFEARLPPVSGTGSWRMVFRASSSDEYFFFNAAWSGGAYTGFTIVKRTGGTDVPISFTMAATGAVAGDIIRAILVGNNYKFFRAPAATKIFAALGSASGYTDSSNFNLAVTQHGFDYRFAAADSGVERFLHIRPQS